MTGPKNLLLNKPNVRITNNEAFFDFVVDIHIKNPFNISWDAAEILSVVTAEVEL